MFGNKKDLKLLDLIDVKFLQEFQDSFAKTANVASITYDDQKQVTNPSNFTEFCIKYTRSTEIGLIRCKECDIIRGKEAAQKGEPVIYKCHTGLTDFAVPIMLEGKHIGSILGGQILTEPPDEEQFRKIAREIGVNEDEYVCAVKKIRVIPIEEIKSAAALLFMVANSVSNMSHTNFSLMKINEAEKIYRKITETIRSSLDIEEIKSKIVSIIGETLNPDRCIIAEYDKKTDKLSNITYEHLSSDKIKGFKGVDVNELVPNFTATLKNGKSIVVNNKKIFIDSQIKYFEEETKAIEEYGVNSAFIVPFYYSGEFLGAMAIQYVNDRHYIGDEEVRFLTLVADQISIALHQARIYKLTQQQADRERLLRKIFEKIRSSLDIEETLSFICEETTKFFNVQRSSISQFFFIDNSPRLKFKKEYKLARGITGADYIENISGVANFAYSLFSRINIYEINNINSSDLPGFFATVYKEMGIKSVLAAAIRKGQSLWGLLVLTEYGDYRNWTKEEVELLNAIATQVDIAINQAELFEKMQLTATNERTLRELMLASVSSVDLKEIIKSIVIQTGKLFKADRCFFVEIDAETQSNRPIKDYAEYLSSKNISSHIIRTAEKSETGAFIKQLKPQDVVYCNDIYKEDLPEATKKMLIDELSVKSYIFTPVFYMDKLYGSIVLHYVNSFKEFSQDDVDMILAVGNQSAIILHQTELYELTKAQAEKEKVSRNIVEILRSTLDKKSIKNLFVKTIGEYFEADRVLFSEYDFINKMYLPVEEDSEYLSSVKEKSFIDYDWSEPSLVEYIQPLLEKRELNIFCWDEYIKDNKKSKAFISLFEDAEVKSSYNIPVIYQERLMGFFCIEFTQKCCKLSDQDLDLVRDICNQAGIALYQAELYVKAEESSRIKGEFIANMSHEIKTPLSIIIGFSDVLAENEINRDKQIEYLSNIKKSGKHLLDLTNDILLMSKIESQTLELNCSFISIDKLIIDVVNSIKLMAECKNINIEIEMPEELNVKVDKKILTQILYNLLNNAIKFTLNNGKIIVKAVLDADSLIISVEDDGIGISAVDQAFVFEKFRQVDSSYKRKETGAGLGLSITKKLVEFHGGAIYIESIKNKGSKFWFTLPGAIVK